MQSCTSSLQKIATSTLNAHKNDALVKKGEIKQSMHTTDIVETTRKIKYRCKN